MRILWRNSGIFAKANFKTALEVKRVLSMAVLYYLGMY